MKKAMWTGLAVIALLNPPAYASISYSKNGSACDETGLYKAQ